MQEGGQSAEWEVGGDRKGRTSQLRAERLGSTEAGLKTCGCDSWLVLRLTLCCISGSKDKGMSFECQGYLCRW